MRDCFRFWPRHCWSWHVFCRGGAVAQYLECNTVVTAADSVSINSMAPVYQHSTEAAVVRCFIHILTQTDGSGGLDQAIVDSMLVVATADLRTLSIYLTAVGQDSIANPSYYATPDGSTSALFAENPHADAIDIYLGPAAGPARGRAAGVSSSSLVLTGWLDSYSALSHILGNCLGLYATDEQVFGIESPDGFTGASTGDLVVDTLADPGLAGFVLPNCALDQSFAELYPGYAPDPSNIMSSGRMDCWSKFSRGQRDRVLAALEAGGALSNVFCSEPALAPYADYTRDTLLRQMIHYPLDPSNVAAFDFSGNSLKDVMISGVTDANEEKGRTCAGVSIKLSANQVPVFQDRSEVTFGNVSTTADSPPHGTTGIVLGDYDNDGDLDFYAPNLGNGDHPHYSHRLYRNDGGGHFSNVTAFLFGAASDKLTATGSWGDFDGDGYLDLVVGKHSAGVPSGLTLYHNEALNDGHPEHRIFVDVTASTEFSVVNWSDSIMWIDLDQDHDMDLITLVYKQSDLRSHPPDLVYQHSRYYENIDGVLIDSSWTKFRLFSIISG